MKHRELDETYVYDASGNITEKTIAGVQQSFDYDLANQLKVSRIGTETTRYRYDNAGCLVAELDGHDPVAEYQYGCRDRVIELVRSDTAVKYHYAADGMVAGKQRTSADNRVQVAQAGFGFFSSGSSGRHDYSDSAIEPWVWEDAFGAGGAPRGAKALLAKGDDSYSNEPHVSGGVPIAGSDRVSEDEKFFVSDYLGNTLMELPGKESTEFDKGRRDTAGFSFLTTAMGANVESDGSVSGDDPAMNRFTGKPYDEDLQAYVFPFRNYSAKLARWTSADPAGFPDGPNRHFYAPVPTSGLDPLGLEDKEIINAQESVSSRSVVGDSELQISFEVLEGIGTSGGAAIYEVGWKYSIEANTTYVDEDNISGNYDGVLEKTGTIYDPNILYYDGVSSGGLGAISPASLVGLLGGIVGGVLADELVGDWPLNPSEDFNNVLQQIANAAPSDLSDMEWRDVEFEI